MTKQILYAELGFKRASTSQRAAHYATNDIVNLSQEQLFVAKDYFEFLKSQKFSNRQEELVAAIQFATWLNSCK